jgi:hypothetical protein
MIAAAGALAACVPYPGEAPAPGQTTVVEGPFGALDAGAARVETLHFETRGYGGPETQRLADTAEASYNRIMVDTDLYSFKPRGLYQIVVYGSQEEYRKKTGQPDWSGGVSVGNAIFTFQRPGVETTIAHEMTHLIMYEFMGRVEPDHRWINEGLAVYEESKAATAAGYHGDPYADARARIRGNPIPLDQMIRLTPASERDTTVSAWYAQADSMIRFMIERGSRLGFSQFLQSLRDNRPLDAAIGGAFPGVWRDSGDFYRAWQAAQQ